MHAVTQSTTMEVVDTEAELAVRVCSVVPVCMAMKLGGATPNKHGRDVKIHVQWSKDGFVN